MVHGPSFLGNIGTLLLFQTVVKDHLGPDKSNFMKVFSLSTKGTKEVQSSDTSVIKELIKPLNLHVRFFKGKNPNMYRFSLIEKNSLL